LLQYEEGELQFLVAAFGILVASLGGRWWTWRVGLVVELHRVEEYLGAGSIDRVWVA
jgi:hypothetical protein